MWQALAFLEMRSWSTSDADFDRRQSDQAGTSDCSVPRWGMRSPISGVLEPPSSQGGRGFDHGASAPTSSRAFNYPVCVSGSG